MTNAIEQAKRNMYYAMSRVKTMIAEGVVPNRVLPVFEENLEAYLELLRQDHEALHETARKRFEDLQAAEAANQELQAKNDKQCESIRSLLARLEKMTEERDSIQLRMHAVDHAYKTQQDRTATQTQDSGDRASCATPDAKAMVLLGALVDAQRVIVDYLVPDGIRAKNAIGKLIPILDNQKLVIAMRQFEVKPRCMHSFFAIGDDQMKCTFCGVGK